MRSTARPLLLATVAALLLAGMIGWIRGTEPAPAPLRVGLLVWPPYEFGFLAQSLGEYDDLDLEIVDYQTPAEAVRAYRSGLIDAVALTSDFLVQLAESNPSHRAIFVTDVSDGGDALVTRTEITSLAELKGRSIGLEASALGAYMLTRVLEHAGLNREDVELVAVDTADQLAAFQDGRVDAVITYDPTRTLLLESGAHSLFDSSQIPGEVVDVLICREELLLERRDDVRAFLAGWLRAIDYYMANPDEGAALMARRESTTPEFFRQSLESVWLPTIEENLALLEDPDSPLLRGLSRSGEILKEKGLIEELRVSPALLDGSVLRELLE